MRGPKITGGTDAQRVLVSEAAHGFDGYEFVITETPWIEGSAARAAVLLYDILGERVVEVSASAVEEELRRQRERRLSVVKWAFIFRHEARLLAIGKEDKAGLIADLEDLAALLAPYRPGDPEWAVMEEVWSGLHATYVLTKHVVTTEEFMALARDADRRVNHA